MNTQSLDMRTQRHKLSCKWETQICTHTHIYTQSQFKELQLHLRNGSGQHRYDEEGELLTVCLVEQHQTVVCVRADSMSADNVRTHSQREKWGCWYQVLTHCSTWCSFCLQRLSAMTERHLLWWPLKLLNMIHSFRHIFLSDQICSAGKLIGRISYKVTEYSGKVCHHRPNQRLFAFALQFLVTESASHDIQLKDGQIHRNDHDAITLLQFQGWKLF